MNRPRTKMATAIFMLGAVLWGTSQEACAQVQQPKRGAFTSYGGRFIGGIWTDLPSEIIDSVPMFAAGDYTYTEATRIHSANIMLGVVKQWGDFRLLPEIAAIVNAPETGKTYFGPGVSGEYALGLLKLKTKLNLRIDGGGVQFWTDSSVAFTPVVNRSGAGILRFVFGAGLRTAGFYPAVPLRIGLDWQSKPCTDGVGMFGSRIAGVSAAYEPLFIPDQNPYIGDTVAVLHGLSARIFVGKNPCPKDPKD